MDVRFWAVRSDDFGVCLALWSLLFLPFLGPVSAAPTHHSTVDLLQDQSVVSAEVIEKHNEECDMHRLCSSEDLEVALICGSDGRTYNSPCEIKKAICHGNPVRLQFKGPCPEKSKCRLEKRFQESLGRTRNQSSIFVPACEADGSYASVQCHASTGYCWCVTKEGRPIPATSVQFKRPNCRPQGKVGRRSSRRKLGRRRKDCSTADRSTFNNNLLKMFKTEFERNPSGKKKKGPLKDGVMTSIEKRIIDWKFGQLDRNRNGVLSRKELRGLKGLVRKLVEPRPCSRRFTRYCDLNHDRKVTRTEWFTCLEIDINRMAFTFMRANLDLVGWASGSNQSDFFLKESAASSSDADGSEDDSPTDCGSHRRKALAEQETDPRSASYIPNCSDQDENNYARVQCHKGSQFCWCADPTSGKPIPGTSVRYVRPNCQQQAPVDLGEISRCPKRKQQRFFVRLHSTLESSLIASGHSSFSEEMSSKEMAVRWKFQQLDANKNGKLERREWKHYRLEMKTWKGVRRCGRNFIRFCDRNGDKNLSLQEWIDCALRANSKPTSPSPFALGKNPFLHILDPNQ